MRALVLSLLLASLFVAVPAAAALAGDLPEESCRQPYFEAYACFWGHVGAQDVTVCGKNLGDYCVPFL